MVFCNLQAMILKLHSKCHNPYFNRWFSAIDTEICTYTEEQMSHNPYFNRWFSAIGNMNVYALNTGMSQSLF